MQDPSFLWHCLNPPFAGFVRYLRCQLLRVSQSLQAIRRSCDSLWAPWGSGLSTSTSWLCWWCQLVQPQIWTLWRHHLTPTVVPARLQVLQRGSAPWSVRFHSCLNSFFSPMHQGKAPAHGAGKGQSDRAQPWLSQGPQGSTAQPSPAGRASSCLCGHTNPEPAPGQSRESTSHISAR